MIAAVAAAVATAVAASLMASVTFEVSDLTTVGAILSNVIDCLANLEAVTA
ncbi:hypothetical protein [Paenibacillus sp. PL91]|uniref:hypothetical protein n=1 Tax=Paenibacillus sp. PL91 TaxID=2729538 RepID=UPI001659002A|nr:hypothetical protein [Paenibacillus sp. PL91]MBC9201327.1 hypothetical protein [Paenibacillus sp. PL91]